MSVVETTTGKVRGETKHGISLWRGIPYAEPPIGPLRFRPPVPVRPWAGARDATRFGPVAAQSRDPRVAMMSGVADKVASSEDCLTLNIYSPAADGKRRPVMVWIHGGAFIMGSGSTPLYNGPSFAANHDIVFVTLNYRLGVLGFLYLGDVARDRAEGNYALLDQVCALRWVKDNIAAFGGDPDQITVMGESAGGMSIATLLGMPAARGLFHRAILQSGAGTLTVQGRDDAAAVARSVFDDLGVHVEQLADVPFERLLVTQDRLGREMGLAAFAPYVDGVTLPAPPIEAVRAGHAAGIAMLLGTNRDEWTLFEVFLGEVTVDALKEPVRSRLGPARTQELLAAYGKPEQRAWVDLVGDVAFRIPAIRLAEAQSAFAPVYMYRFDWASPALSGRLGAAHAMELPFVWDRLDLPLSQLLLGTDVAACQPLATRMHAAWASFIASGVPEPDWPTYDRQRRATMIFDRESRVEDDPGRETRALWPPV